MIFPKGVPMSDISINNNISQVNTANKTTAPVAQSSSSAKPANIDNSSASSNDVVSKEYGPVVSISEDGDTVRVKNDEKEEGIHDILQNEIDELEKDFDMPDFQVHKPSVTLDEDKAVEKENENVKPEITSYIGFTDTELKELYLKGDISQIDYNLEMEAREARRDEAAKKDQAFSNNLADNISRQSEITRNADTISTIENGENSSTIPDELRLQALQNFDTV